MVATKPIYGVGFRRLVVNCGSLDCFRIRNNSESNRVPEKCFNNRKFPLSEKLFTISGVDPVAVLGANDANLRLIRPLFPKLNLIARGDTLKVSGAEADIALFEERFNELVAHVARYNDLPRKVLDDIMGTGERGEVSLG